jgi:excinuclease UvrABC nuclease subunit
MYAASAALDFEKAARLATTWGALNKALQKQGGGVRRRHRCAS